LAIWDTWAYYSFSYTPRSCSCCRWRLDLSGSKLYISFLVRRIFRIYPLSILAVIFAIYFHIPSASFGGKYSWAGWQELFSNILLTQNITQSGSVNCVLWSLPFEVQMYAILQIVYFLLCRFTSLWAAWFIWMAGASVAGTEYIMRSGSCDLVYLLARYFPCFLAGVLAWRLLKMRNARLSGALWGVFLAIIIVAYRVIDIIRVYGPDWFSALHGTLRSDHKIWWPPYLSLVNDWAFCCIVGLMIPFFASITNRWLNEISKRVARYSYGIYVCHVPILWLCFVKFHVTPVAVSVVLSLFLTMLVSILLFNWLENPAIKFGKQFSTQIVQNTVHA
jgi:peptidoglycan/LPS O-acetylase OafA/YrhL